MTVGSILIGFLCVLLLIFIWTTYVNFKKVELYEEQLQSYDNFYSMLNMQAIEIYKQIKQIDIRGSFEVDDEVGLIYKGIKSVVLKLQDFLPGVEITDEKK